MRVVFMIDHMHGFGGAQRVIANLANAFFSKGDHVLILLTGNNKQCVYNLDKDINIYASTKSNKIAKYCALRKKIKEFSPSVIISFLPLVNILSLVLTRGLNIPVIISERNDPDHEPTFVKILSKIFYRYATHIVVQTDEIRKKIGLYCKRDITIIPNPLVEHSVEKKDYELSNRILSVGRLNKQKNIYLLIDSFLEIYNKFPEFSLDIYGEGDLKSALSDYIKSRNLSHVVILKGVCPNLISHEPEYDLFVMTSDFEGMPNALVEAMSIGLPCISTNFDGGGASYLINNKINGIVVEKGDKNGIVSSIEYLIENESVRKKIGEEAKKINIELSPLAITEQWMNIINSCISINLDK